MILDGLVSNAGMSSQRKFVDEMLLERLRTMATDPMTDRDVRNRLAGMFIGWHAEFKDVPAMGGVAHLKESLPKRKAVAMIVRPPTPDSDDDESEERRAPVSRGHSRNTSETGPSTPKQPARRSSLQIGSTDSPTAKYKYVEPTTPPKEKVSFFAGSTKSKSSKKNTPIKISLDKEKPRILQTIAAANQASTNLQNALRHVNKEDSSFLQAPQIVKPHRDCREIRKAVLHYVSGIESEEWVGTLLQTNDSLVAALQMYEQYRIMATAPDSDEEDQQELRRRHITNVYGVDDQDLPPRKPARPGQAKSSSARQTRQPAAVQESESEEDDDASEADEDEDVISEGDENDPFSNHYQDPSLQTPAIEKSQPKW